MRVLSVVCARAGSKGLKNKCIARLDNKMVVEYSIEYSLSLGDDVKTVVSTDIEELIDFCKRNSIDYIKRDPEICTDDSRIDDALADAIEKKGQSCDYCSLVYGNIPTRYPAIWWEGLRFLEHNKDYDCVISMQNVEKFHPDWMFSYSDEILPKEEKGQYRRQQLPKKMIHDGHTLIFKAKEFYKRYNNLIPYDKRIGYAIYGDKIRPLITTDVIIDIDTKKDLKLAEAVIANHLRKNMCS